MRIESKHQNKLSGVLLTFLFAAIGFASYADSIPSGFSHPLVWRLGAEVVPAWVPGTNGFLDGENPLGRNIRNNLSASLRAGFSFAPDTREGFLYKGLYQGVGLGYTTFYSSELLGTPMSAYIYQGAPIIRFSPKLWLGYEWQFGAAFGWKHYDHETAENNAVVSTSVTARMGLGIKMHYDMTSRVRLSFGLEAIHYSNGNTSWPNAGVNSLGASVGVACLLGSDKSSEEAEAPAWLEEEADRGRWFYDLIAFGAWRKRIVNVGDPPTAELCPGKFAIAGFQVSPMRRLNRWVAVGAALDVQWDESAGLAPYWVEGSSDENIKFERPPFMKQVSAGLSAHAELTVPIFSVNAGLGYDGLSPRGNNRFYQSLTLKTFVTDKLFLNVGYRLGDFKEPQNLMLGLGVRL